MAKRAAFDMSALTSLTAEPAVPMPKAPAPEPERDVAPVSLPATVETASGRAKPAAARRSSSRPKGVQYPSDALEPLQFRVTADFRQRFRRAAFDRDMKLNELLYAIFEAWDKRAGN